MSCCNCSFMCPRSTTGKRAVRSTDNSRLPRTQMRGYGSIFGPSFVAGLNFIEVGEILGNVYNDIHVHFKHKQPSSPIIRFFRGMPL